MTGDWLDGELPKVQEIHRRLSLTIPEGNDSRGWARRELAAKTIFVMLYSYAVEGFDQWIRPTAIADMTDDQAADQKPESRRRWISTVQGRKRPKDVTGRWYSENTRESIRDETLHTLLELGAVIERTGLPTTSPKPRYALSRAFADLFPPQISENELRLAIDDWQEDNLSATALARLILSRRGKGARSERVLIRLPNGETRSLAPGKSSLLTRSVIEEFASRFLVEPAAVMISESAKKLIYRDEEITEAIGLRINVSKSLPDVVMADLGSTPLLIIFVECVVTDGAIDGRRKKELETLALGGGYKISDCVFVTAFRDRTDKAYRRMAPSLAWGTFVWFENEPDHIVLLRKGTEKRKTQLGQLLQLVDR